MKEVDYLIVGAGIAGISFAEQLLTHKKTFIVVDKGFNASTAVSGGVLNPTVLKRFTAAWNGSEFIKTAFRFYTSLSKRLGLSIFQEMTILRILSSVEEQNNWMIASDKHALANFLASEILPNDNERIHAPFGFGRVQGAGRIFPSVVLEAYRTYLEAAELLISEEMNYDALILSEENVRYKNIVAKKIVFAEGAGVLNNPLFPKEYLVPNKGEYIIIHAPELKTNAILKGPLMLIPLGNDTYKVGASYGRGDTTNHPTEIAKDEMCLKLQRMISCPFEVIDQVAGVRPTVKDRKPLMGPLAQNKTSVFYNGLGTRGILMAPRLAELLYNFCENGVALPSEVNINRFN